MLIQFRLLRLILIGLISIVLNACATVPPTKFENMESIDKALRNIYTTEQGESYITPPPDVTAALLPQINTNLAALLPDVETRVDISAKATPAQSFFMSLVKGTNLNMVVHPDVKGTISISLRDVTLEESLATVRDVYGYRYRRRGNTFQVFPASMRTQVFTVNYLDIVRDGSSQTSVSSGEVNNTDSNSAATPSNASTQSDELSSGSEVRTNSQSDFWKDLQESLSLIVGSRDGRKVVLHPQSGVIVVHAMQEELVDVQNYLNTIENVAQRLVVLEAKIIEVTLNDSFQAGVNWSNLIDSSNDKSILLGHSGATISPTPLGGIFSINANLSNFNSLIELLKTQGDVQVLSSPRISTLNNQKAVIKVGQDEYFVTDFETDTELTNGVGNQNVDVSLTPFFSGVALDVLPQIDADDNVILHIHPAISEVMEKAKNIRTSTDNDISLPLALSTIRESDSVVRAQSGQVIVVGGLMKDALRREESRTPILGDIPLLGNLFRNVSEVATKSELVILLRPVVIKSEDQWDNKLSNTTDRFNNLRTMNSTGTSNLMPMEPEHVP